METLFTLPEKVGGLKTTTKTNAAIAEKIAKAKASLVRKENYKIVGRDCSLGTIAKEISKHRIFAFDTETGGVNVWRDPLYCISIFVGGNSYLINFAHALIEICSKDEFCGILGEYFQSNNYRRVGFNYKFDAHAISNNTPILVGDCYFDGFVAVWLINENEDRKGLKPLCSKYLGMDLSNYDEQFGTTAWTVIDPAVAADYACKDAELHFLLYEFQESELKKMPAVHKIMHNLEMPFANMMLKTEREGIKVDVPYFKDELPLRLLTKMADLDIQMAQAVNKKWKTLEGVVDVDSPKQLGDFLFNYLKLPRINGDHTGHSVLEELEHKHKIIPPLKEYRKVRKLKTGFQEAILERHINGRIHPTFKSIGTETGRPAGVEPNLNQIPARSFGEIEASIIRQGFLSDDGYCFVSKDFSGQELRIQAGVSGDRKLIQLILDGVDFYSYCAAIAYGGVWQDFDKHGARSAERDKSKRAVLAMCLPTSNTEILTKEGWKKYNELKIGMETLGYKNGHLEWTKIKNIFVYENQPILKLKNRWWEVESTPNHRWLSNTRKQIGHKGFRYYKEEFIETQNINTESNLIRSAPNFTLDNSKISPQEAAILGWLFTDGNIKISPLTKIKSQGKNGQRRKIIGTIIQAKPKYVEEIKKLLKNIPHVVYIRKPKSYQNYLIYEFRIETSWLRELWNKTNLWDKNNLSKLILSFGPLQRKAFIEAGLHAEGNLFKDCWIFTQNEGPVLDAFELAFFLEGYTPLKNLKRKAGSSGKFKCNKNCYTIRLGSSKISGQRLKKEKLENKQVFCIKTDLGTFVTKQNNKIFLTGNSYGAQAPKIAWVLGCNKSLAQKFIDDFESEFPDLAEYQRAQIKFAKKHGYIETFLGRRQRIIFHPDATPAQIARNERLCKNRWVQAGAADQIKISFVLCYNHSVDNGYLSRPLWEIYDEIIFKVNLQEMKILDEYDEIMRNCIDIGILFTTTTEIYPERWGILK